MSFEKCVGAVLPVVESCVSDVDDDCNGAVNDRCAAWAKRFGGPQDQYATAFALAADGGIVFTGELGGSTNFGGGTLTSAGSTDLFVARLDAAGEYVWASRFGNNAAQAGRALAIDNDGNILVAGSFVGTLDFGVPTLPLTSAGLEDIFVAKLDPLGQPIWSVRFGNTVAQGARGLAVAADGSVFVTGELAGSVVFGADTVASAGSTDGFLLKLDATDGTPLWVHGFGGSSTDSGADVALGAGGTVHLTGFFTGTITLAEATLVGRGGNDALVAKLTADGVHLWSRGFGAADTQKGGAIAVAPGGDVLVAGTFSGGIDFGRGEVASLGAEDGFALRLDPGGEVLWSALFQGTDLVTPQGIAVDPAGNAAIVGGFRGEADFGGGKQKMAGPDDFFLVVLDPAGAYRYSRIFGDFDDQDARAVAFDPAGSLFLLGEISASTDFGTGPLTSAGGEDMVVVKIAP
jgi:outer membrane protein assembly factor BamB